MEQPTGKHARVEVADVLRGLAVMGIILLHSIEHFNFYSFPDTTGQSAWLTFTDKAVWDGLFFLLGGKAYAVFALLFGFSYFIQYDNQRMRGHDFRLRFCWRLILLFLIGNLNAMFFTAEVLVLYSLVGFILPLTCKMKDKWIFVLACILLIQPLPLYYTLRACFDPAFVTPALPTGDLWEPHSKYKAMALSGKQYVSICGKGNLPALPGHGTMDVYSKQLPSSYSDFWQENAVCS